MHNGKKEAGTVGGNTPVAIAAHHGRYLTDNPIVLSGKEDLPYNINLSRFLGPKGQFITENEFLIASCPQQDPIIDHCFEIKADKQSDYLEKEKERWQFTTDTSAFRQVQAFGNVRDLTEKFIDLLKFSFELGGNANYSSSHPAQLFSPTLRPFWFNKHPLQEGSGKLTIYSDCTDVEDNAYYDPAKNEICLGKFSFVENNYFVHDPQITWHELGHGLSKIMINTRNMASTNAFMEETSLGGYHSYDEAGAIDEGIADYWSFVMNGRTHFSDWALGLFLNASRPMSERDNLHSRGIATSFARRLSYPEFLSYDPNEPKEQKEDIHYAGQIISHFLTAFTFDVKKYCNLELNEATRYVVHLLMETFAELGDQSSKAFDGATTARVNHIPSASLEWIRYANPINFRRFMQVLGKFHMLNLASGDQCSSDDYSKDLYERLVDSYGLLLYRTYNNNGSGVTDGHAAGNIAVAEKNIKKSVFIRKDHLKLATGEQGQSAYIVDAQANIADIIDSLKAKGQIHEISSMIDENFAYNYGNGLIAPGEVVGLMLNIYNASNSTIGGLQILAGDWDHTKGGIPCNNFSDNWPPDGQGAADLSSGEGAPGGCDYTTRTNGTDTQMEQGETLAPACFVQLESEGASKWFPQGELRKRLNIDMDNCLGGEDGNENDCFIRIIKGAENAYFSKINPNSTWIKTFSSDNEIPTFNGGSHLIYMEVNPLIPTGTTFNCRFRLRFTNCLDCWHDQNQNNDDYLDFEYSGPRPFKIINYKFDVHY